MGDGTDAAAAAAAAAGPLAQALQGVVAIAAGGAWATGVVVSSTGHILTNAHLLPPGAASAPAPRPLCAAQQELQLAPAAAVAAAPLRVLLPAVGGGGGGGSRWAAADVRYVFRGPLDLAVLQLQQPWQPPVPSWRPLALAPRGAHPGQRVCVAGFPAFNPRSSPLQAAVLTAGNLAKVRGRPACLPWARMVQLCSFPPAALSSPQPLVPSSQLPSVLDMRLPPALRR